MVGGTPGAKDCTLEQHPPRRRGSAFARSFVPFRVGMDRRARAMLDQSGWQLFKLEPEIPLQE